MRSVCGWLYIVIKKIRVFNLQINNLKSASHLFVHCRNWNKSFFLSKFFFLSKLTCKKYFSAAFHNIMITKDIGCGFDPYALWSPFFMYENIHLLILPFLILEKIILNTNIDLSCNEKAIKIKRNNAIIVKKQKQNMIIILYLKITS